MRDELVVSSENRQAGPDVARSHSMRPHRKNGAPDQEELQEQGQDPAEDV